MLLKVLSMIVAWIPWKGIYAISSFLARVVSLVYRRQVVSKNLRQALPGLNDEERRRVEHACYLNLTDVAFETIKGFSATREQLGQRVRIHRNSAVRELEQHQGPFLLYASHFANWEWIALAFGLQIAPVDPIYKPLTHSSADSWMYQYRSRFGNRPIHLDEVASTIRRLREFRALGIVADQSPSKGNKGKVWASFMGLPSAFYKGVFTLPYLTQWPAYYASMTRLKRGYYEVTIHPLGAPPYEKRDLGVLEAYIHFAEQEIKADPSSWLWTHNRWKYAKRDNEELLIFRK